MILCDNSELVFWEVFCPGLIPAKKAEDDGTAASPRIGGSDHPISDAFFGVRFPARRIAADQDISVSGKG